MPQLSTNSLKRTNRATFVAGLFALLLALSFIASAEDGANADFSQTVMRQRHRALVYALASRPAPSNTEMEINNNTATPEDTAKRFRVLCRSMVHEGGFLKNEASAALGIDTSPIGQIARTFQQLDGANSKINLARPTDPVLTSSLIALCYSQPTLDGVNAARQCASMAGGDKRTQDAGAIAYRMLSACLSGEQDKDRILKQSAAVADDEYVGRMVRSVRLQEWPKLHSEEKSLGRLQRALSLWYHANSAQESNALGQDKLTTPPAKTLLAAFNAAYYGEAPQQKQVHPKTTEEKKETDRSRAELAELATDLYQMAEEGFLLPVDEEVAPAPMTQRTQMSPNTSTPSIPTLTFSPPTAPNAPATPTPPAQPAIASSSANAQTAADTAGTPQTAATPPTPATPTIPVTPASPQTVTLATQTPAAQ